MNKLHRNKALLYQTSPNILVALHQKKICSQESLYHIPIYLVQKSVCKNIMTQNPEENMQGTDGGIILISQDQNYLKNIEKRKRSAGEPSSKRRRATFPARSWKPEITKLPSSSPTRLSVLCSNSFCILTYAPLKYRFILLYQQGHSPCPPK